MGSKPYFAHESPTPGLKSPGDRCKKEGYGGSVGENIATGYADGKAALRRFPGHRADGQIAEPAQQHHDACENQLLRGKAG